MLVGLGSLSLDADMDAFMSGGGGKRFARREGRGRAGAEEGESKAHRSRLT